MTQQIKVNMMNWDKNGEIISRIIDTSVLNRPDYNADDGWETDTPETNKEAQEMILSDWVKNRASEQHEAMLTLESWEFVG